MLVYLLERKENQGAVWITSRHPTETFGSLAPSSLADVGLLLDPDGKIWLLWYKIMIAQGQFVFLWKIQIRMLAKTKTFITFDWGPQTTFDLNFKPFPFFPG